MGEGVGIHLCRLSSIQEKISSSSGGFSFQYSVAELFKGNLTQVVIIKQQNPPFLIIIDQCDTSP